MALSIKQLNFCTEHLKDFNATQAAIRCGYSIKSARNQGFRLLNNNSIKTELKNRQSLILKSSNTTKENVLGELARGAFVELDTSCMKYSDKIKCLELLCKHYGLLSGKAENKRDSSDLRNRLLEAVKNITVRSE